MAENGNGVTVDKLPKVDASLKSELQNFNTELMKKAETNEKNVLPTAQGNRIYSIFQPDIMH